MAIVRPSGLADEPRAQLLHRIHTTQEAAKRFALRIESEDMSCLTPRVGPL
jgi:hypothetical protein